MSSRVMELHLLLPLRGRRAVRRKQRGQVGHILKRRYGAAGSRTSAREVERSPAAVHGHMARHNSAQRGLPAYDDPGAADIPEGGYERAEGPSVLGERELKRHAAKGGSELGRGLEAGNTAEKRNDGIREERLRPGRLPAIARTDQKGLGTYPRQEERRDARQRADALDNRMCAGEVQSLIAAVLIHVQTRECEDAVLRYAVHAEPHAVREGQGEYERHAGAGVDGRRGEPQPFRGGIPEQTAGIA